MRIPEHIAVIPDGNRRWAVAHGMGKGDGYHYGLRPGLLLLRRAKELGIREITYYGFTVDNCKRPSEQVGAFRRACVDAAELLKAEGADFLVLGNTKSRCFPEELKEYRVRKKVGDGSIRLNFLVNYGWEWDLAHMKKDGRPESWDVSRIDHLLRWGGRNRHYRLLPLQSVYADFYKIPHMWPDFKERDLPDALAWYNTQDVTLGG